MQIAFSVFWDNPEMLVTMFYKIIGRLGVGMKGSCSFDQFHVCFPSPPSWFEFTPNGVTDPTKILAEY